MGEIHGAQDNGQADDLEEQELLLLTRAELRAAQQQEAGRLGADSVRTGGADF